MTINEELHPLTVAREARNLSQAQLAEEVKLGPRTIWAAEHQRPISAHSRRQLCRYFKKTAQELGLVSAESAARARKRQKRTQQISVASVKRISPALPSQSNEGFVQSAIPTYTSVETVISPEQLLLRDIGETFVEPERKIVYDTFEVDVVTAVLKYRLLSEPITSLQRSIQATIKGYDDMTQHHESDQTRISRRHALQTIAKFPIQMYALTAFGLENMHLAPAEEILPACAAGITACRALLKDEEIATIEQILSAYLPILETLALQSSVHQQTAAHLVSQSYLLATILADHRRKLDHMESYSRAARRYGQLANDPNLEASALARLAVKFDYERRDRKALQTYQEALALPNFAQVSPLLRGRIYAGLAGSNAYCHQKDDALYYLGLAKDTYPEQVANDPSFHFAYSGENTMSLWEGLTNKHIGHYTAAWNAFSQHAKMQPQPGLRETNRAEFLNYVASIAVKQRELDASSLYIETAEGVAWQIKHEQRYAEVLDTFRSLQMLWPDEPVVRRLQDKFSARHL
jgi:transcriptional regulator with XRE-family HTH domain